MSAAVGAAAEEALETESESDILYGGWGLERVEMGGTALADVAWLGARLLGLAARPVSIFWGVINKNNYVPYGT
jgi:hypothetical protein